MLLLFYFFVKNTLFITKFLNSFCNVNLLSIHKILQNLWMIIRVLRFRPSIFKELISLKNDNRQLKMNYLEGQLQIRITTKATKSRFSVSQALLWKKRMREGNFFFIVSDFFSCFPVDSMVNHCVISYTLPLITKIFSRTARWNTVLMFYNITRAVTIAFNALRNAVVWSNLRKLYYNIVLTI